MWQSITSFAVPFISPPKTQKIYVQNVLNVIEVRINFCHFQNSFARNGFHISNLPGCVSPTQRL